LTDIVERLRKAYPPLAGYQRHVGEEAADEIERLRMQLADHGETITRLQEQLTVVRELRDCDDHDIEVSQMDAVGRLGVAIKRIAERDAKIERLRAALKELADAAEHDMKKNQEDEDGGWWSLWSCVGRVRHGRGRPYGAGRGRHSGCDGSRNWSQHGLLRPHGRQSDG